jgi:hypothetical protein
LPSREPQPPEELNVGTDLNLRKNRPFRIVDRWGTRESVVFLFVGLLSFLVLAYFFWPKR